MYDKNNYIDVYEGPNNQIVLATHLNSVEGIDFIDDEIACGPVGNFIGRCVLCNQNYISTNNEQRNVSRQLIIQPSYRTVDILQH